jgi:hypothetical protein
MGRIGCGALNVGRSGLRQSFGAISTWISGYRSCLLQVKWYWEAAKFLATIRNITAMRVASSGA